MGPAGSKRSAPRKERISPHGEGKGGVKEAPPDVQLSDTPKGGSDG